jgi:hypothetical protein
MIQSLELGGKTFHLRASMGALRAAKTIHGIDMVNMGDDPLDIVRLAYHFACAGAKTQGQELTMSVEDFEDLIIPADLPAIAETLAAIMKVDTKKKRQRQR